MTPPLPDAFSRRLFVQTTAAATMGLMLPYGAYADGREAPLRVGIIGCGGRGTGAATDCMRGSDNIEVVALGDVAPDRLAESITQLTKYVAEYPAYAHKLNLSPDRCFSGFDAYQKVLATDVDLVILATPPGFRPLHLAAAVDAGKHIFTEKPVATDVAGVISVLATYERAAAKGLGIVAGTQRRHHPGYIETIDRIRDGAIGDVLNGQVYWNQGGLWSRARKPEWSDTEWQMRNWLYFTWLSGDHLVEQHVHNMDVANWVMGSHPIRAIGVGGRQWRTAPEYGNVYDHFAIEYEYANGVHVTSMARQIEGTRGRVGEWFQGSKGSSIAHQQRIDGANAWKWVKPETFSSDYVQEHTDLVASIRAGRPLNELKQIAESTLTAIMGRESAYTGQELTWDQTIAAVQDLNPGPLAHLAYGPLDTPQVPMPGRTKLSRSWKEGW